MVTLGVPAVAWNNTQSGTQCLPPPVKLGFYLIRIKEVYFFHANDPVKILSCVISCINQETFHYKNVFFHFVSRQQSCPHSAVSVTTTAFIVFSAMYVWELQLPVEGGGDSMSGNT